MIIVQARFRPRFLAHLRSHFAVVTRVLLVLKPVRDGAHQRHIHVHISRTGGGRREADVVDGHGPLCRTQLPSVGQSCRLLLYAGRVNGCPASVHKRPSLTASPQERKRLLTLPMR